MQAEVFGSKQEEVVRRRQLKKPGRLKMMDQLALQSMVMPSVIFLFVFAYIPMYGIIIAFKDFNIAKGIMDSPWVGLKHFQAFLLDPNLWNVFKNTLFLNVLATLICFPMPIILAILINELKNGWFKKMTQTVSYLPHFLSWVIYGGIVIELLRPKGIISDITVMMGWAAEPVNFMAKGEWFYLIFVMATMIKTIGFGSILYIAAISGVNQEMYEAAEIDGCNRFQKINYITIPAILGTIVIMFILQIGSILSTGIEQILILQNSLNIQYSETLDTYVYKLGIAQGRFSYSTAVNLLKSVISVILLVMANYMSKKITDRGLF